MGSRKTAFRSDEPWTAKVDERSASSSRPNSPAHPIYLTLAESLELLRQPGVAEIRAREFLALNPSDPVATFLHGAALARQGRNEAARTILEPLAVTQPHMGPVWRELGIVLGRIGSREAAIAALLKALDLNYLDKDVLLALGDLLEPSGVSRVANAPLTGFLELSQLFANRDFGPALARADKLLKSQPSSMLLRALKALALTGTGQTDAAISEYQAFIETSNWPGLWLEYARALRSKRDPKAPDAVKRAISILPSFVEAYLFYASIKPFRWDDEMIRTAHAQLGRPDLAPEERAQLHSALGKAYEDLGNYNESFENYRRCNDILRREGNRSAKASANFARRTIAFFSPAFLRRREGGGYPARDPIFIVGMKRSGSTLVEQILSRHSMIEGLGELEILTEVIGRRPGYPQILRQFGPGALREMGAEYAALTARQRKLGRPYFTDKLPHNFGRVGLIHLILPNAKIIDVRRHPLDCGLSCYKHYFPGAQLSLSLDDFASGYADYVKLMSHFDKVLPGKVHRVFYERLVGDLEGEVRRLSAFLGLPFEKACLNFHEDTRQVDTPSADQVRTPLYDLAVEYWRHFDPWLGPMKDRLGPVLASYPDVPEFFSDIQFRLRNPLALGETGREFALVRGLAQRPVAVE